MRKKIGEIFFFFFRNDAGKGTERGGKGRNWKKNLLPKKPINLPRIK